MTWLVVQTMGAQHAATNRVPTPLTAGNSRGPLVRKAEPLLGERDPRSSAAAIRLSCIRRRRP